jgi:hypothetical protein
MLKATVVDRIWFATVEPQVANVSISFPRISWLNRTDRFWLSLARSRENRSAGRRAACPRRFSKTGAKLHCAREWASRIGHLSTRFRAAAFHAESTRFDYDAGVTSP